MVYVIRHHKAKRQPKTEFYVARFLTARLAHIMLMYLIYIRRFANLLRRGQLGHAQAHSPSPHERLLFNLNGKAWPTSRLTAILTDATLKVWQQKLSVRTHRKKHCLL
ncbi:hypothetical protein EDB80DRAFT_182640 [Ilyonectria destructans]|nr:hypothetical protein EDB80DRAFT_182640 [Ilyonectria destructans]